MILHIYRDLFFIFLFSILQYIVHSDPTISTSTPTPCYGDVVTLVCHHPELAGKKYSRVQWRENSGRINLTAGTPFTTNKTWGGTHANLIINITVNHFKFGNKSFNYSCQWKLMQNGQPSRVETSEAVTVDPIGECICTNMQETNTLGQVVCAP